MALKSLSFFVLLFFMATANNALLAQNGSYTHVLSADSATSAYDMSITVNGDNSATAHVLLKEPAAQEQQRFVLRADTAGSISWGKKLQQPSSFYSEINTTAVITIPGGYFDCSTSMYTPDFERKPICIRSDTSGTPVWAKVYHTPGYYSLGDPQCGRLNDGSFVVAAYMYSFLKIGYVNLFRLDSNGTVQWSYIYNPSITDGTETYLALTPAQCIVVMAERSSGGILGSAVIRARADGSPHWMHRYLKGNWLAPVGIQSSAGDSIWILSKTPDFLNNKNPVIIKTDSLGQVAWSKEYAYPNHDITPEGCITTADSGLITYGTVLTLAAPAHSYLMKTDRQGNVVWARNSSVALIKSIAETPSGDLVYVGNDINNSAQLIMGRKDALGRDDCDTAMLPFTVQPVVTTWIADSVAAPVTAGAITLNYTATPANFSDSAICIQPNAIAAYDAPDQLIVWPNPATNTVHLGGLQQPAVVRLFNSGGQLCMQQNIKAGEQQVDVSPLAEGLYFIIVDSGNKRAVHKLIIQR